MIRTTTVEIALSDWAGVTGRLDVERMGVWVRFEATIVERDSGHGSQPVVSQLSARDDDGVVVPISQPEHASLVMMFLQSYYRWRRLSRV